MSLRSLFQRVWPRRLRTRLLIAMSTFALLTTGLFTLYALAFAYTVEDRFIDRALTAAGGAQDNTSVPISSVVLAVQRYTRIDQMPEDLARVLTMEPGRREVAGDQGRHYHVQRGSDGSYRVAEVSGVLVFRGMRATVVEILLWSIFGTLALALLLGYGIAELTTRRLARLAASMQQLDPRALPNSIGSSDANDEVAIVERGINDLLARLASHIEREQHFTRDASHELRTPLTVIRSAGEQLADDTNLHAAARERAAAIASSAARLADTVQALLVLARQDTLTKERATPLLPALEACILELARYTPKQPQLKLHVPRATHVAMPPALLDVLLRNIVGNAFAHHEGSVRIVAHNGYCRFANRSSHGLDEQDFAAFSKGARSSGMGLGLAIIQRLNERFGLGLSFGYDHSSQQVWVDIPVESTATDPTAGEALPQTLV